MLSNRKRIFPMQVRRILKDLFFRPRLHLHRRPMSSQKGNRRVTTRARPYKSRLRQQKNLFGPYLPRRSSS